jgi:hypothetical protein
MPFTPTSGPGSSHQQNGQGQQLQRAVTNDEFESPFPMLVEIPAGAALVA